MKSSEEAAIEKVMAGLREAKASPGMECRILEAVEDRALARSRSGWPMWLTRRARSSAGRWLAWGVGAAGVLTMVLAGSWMSRSGNAPAPARVNVAGPVSQPRAISGLIAEGPQLSPAPSSRRSVGRPVTTRMRAARETSSVAQRETRLASYPAPPMPLTEQEKLLLRIAHAGDPVELAMLNPEVRAKQDAQGDTDFREFFPPPPPQPITSQVAPTPAPPTQEIEDEDNR